MTLTIAELAQALNGRLWGEGRLVVTGAAEAGQAGEGQIALATSPAYTTRLAPGGMALLAEGADPEALGLRAAIIVGRPRLAMASLTRAFDAGPEIAPGIHPSAIIAPDAAAALDRSEMSSVASNTPCAPVPRAWTMRSGIRSWSK